MFNFFLFTTIFKNMTYSKFKNSHCIKNNKLNRESVWENMAQMCVKSHRIDVAKVCLGNMGNVKGIRLLREEIAKGADTDTQVAIVALNLGMFVRLINQMI